MRERYAISITKAAANVASTVTHAAADHAADADADRRQQPDAVSFRCRGRPPAVRHGRTQYGFAQPLLYTRSGEVKTTTRRSVAITES